MRRSPWEKKGNKKNVTGKGLLMGERGSTGEEKVELGRRMGKENQHKVLRKCFQHP